MLLSTQDFTDNHAGKRLGDGADRIDFAEPSGMWVRAITVPEGWIQVRFQGVDGDPWGAVLRVPPGPYLRRRENPWEW